MSIIEFKGVHKVYPNGTQALRNVSFTIDAGEFVFVVGESGAGKSSLIKLLSCEERPSQGSVILDGEDISQLPDKYVPFLRRKLGMIFQDFRLIPSRTVAENVAYAMEVVGAGSSEIKRRVPLVLSVVGLRDKANVYPAELSGGEGQRVGIARAIVNNPRLILADEPTGNLDPVNSEAIMALLERINRNGTTIIACTHAHEIVNKMQKRVLRLEQGMLARDEYCGNYYCIDRKEGLAPIEKGHAEISGSQFFQDQKEQIITEPEQSDNLSSDRAEAAGPEEEKSTTSQTQSDFDKERTQSFEKTEAMKEVLEKIEERMQQREEMRARRRAHLDSMSKSNSVSDSDDVNTNL